MSEPPANVAEPTKGTEPAKKTEPSTEPSIEPSTEPTSQGTKLAAKGISSMRTKVKDANSSYNCRTNVWLVLVKRVEEVLFELHVEVVQSVGRVTT